MDLVRVHQVELGVPDALSHDPVTFAAFAVSCGRSEEVLLQVATDGWADYVAALLSAGADKVSLSTPALSSAARLAAEGGCKEGLEAHRRLQAAPHRRTRRPRRLRGAAAEGRRRE